MGLGLAITRHLVEMHGGTIEAKSKGERFGSTFRIRLPIASVTDLNNPFIDSTTSEVSRRTPSNIEHPNLAGVKILAIDDLDDTRELLRVVLEQYGADVLTLSWVREALEAMARWKPDVIVCDIGMPEEDGYSFIKQVRMRKHDEGGNTPAIALTGYARVEDRRRALEAGYQMFVPKPVEAIELGNVIATLLLRHSKISDPTGA